MRAALGVGLVSFIAFVAAPQRVQSDSIYMVPLALEFVQHGTLTLDRYAETCARMPHGCAELNGHLRSEFPVGPALVAAVPLGLFEVLVHLTAPLTRLVPPLANQVARWEAHAHARGDVDLSFFDVTENLLASLCCAAAAVLFVLAVRQRLPVREAVGLGLVFALGTAVFSSASRVLWQSGPALLFASLALWLLVSGRVGPLLGASLAAAWVCRPTMALHEATFTTLESPESPAEAAARRKSPLAVALARKDLEMVCRAPAPWISDAVVKSPKAKSLQLELTLTDAKWGAHLKVGRCFDSSSYDVTPPPPPAPRVKAADLQKVLDGFAAPTSAARVAAGRAMQRLHKKVGVKWWDLTGMAPDALHRGLIGLLRDRLASEQFPFTEAELVRELAQVFPFATSATPGLPEVMEELLTRGLRGDLGLAWVTLAGCAPDGWVPGLARVASTNENEAVRITAIEALLQGQSKAAKAAVKKLVPWLKKGAARTRITDRKQMQASVFKDLLEQLEA